MPICFRLHPQRTRIASRLGLSLLATILSVTAPSLLGRTTAPSHPSTPCLQEPSDPAPRFDVATIKPSGSGGLVGLYTYPGGKLYAGHATLVNLIEDAFALPSFQVRGAAAWMTATAYDVTALPPETLPTRRLNPSSIKAPPVPEQRSMLQSLLKDRFGLPALRVSPRSRLSPRAIRQTWYVRA